MRPFTPDELDAELRRLPDWISTDFAIHRAWTFPTFRAAMQFVNAVAEQAEAHNHHPDIEIRYREVSLSLWTHTANGVTKHDIELARAISAIATSPHT